MMQRLISQASVFEELMWWQNEGATVYALCNPLSHEKGIAQLFDVIESHSYTLLFKAFEVKDLLKVSPVLIELSDLNSSLAQHLYAWDKWGFFFVSYSTLDTCNDHFFSLLNVITHEGNLVHFRYYDSTILARFLTVCSNDERNSFVGPCAAVYIPPLRSDQQWDVFAQTADSFSVQYTSFQVQRSPWWHMTERHNQAFVDLFASILCHNFALRFWNEHTPLALTLDANGGLDLFVSSAHKQAVSEGLVEECELWARIKQLADERAKMPDTAIKE